MFEYLMPSLLMRRYEGTLLDQSQRAIVQRQIDYGRQKGVPWGISEAGYYGFDAHMNYQYRGFGVPGLGFKRGLGEDLVVSPYASLLALPLDPQDPGEVYEEFQEYILPYPIGNIHPRFWGWVIGTGTVFGALAELLAASMNTNTGGLDHHSANYVEKQVIDWIKEMLGFPSEASGLLTSGCSAANLIGLS